MEAMAKKDRNFVVIPVAGSLALDTLADDTVLSVDLTGSLGEDLFVISTDLDWHVRGLTAGQGDPMTVGIAHSDYSDVEIREAVDGTFTSPDELIEKEQTQRKVRKSGSMVSMAGDNTHTELNFAPFFQKWSARTPARWSVGNGLALSGWIWNRSGGALTTGAILEFDGNIYGRWQR